MVIDPGQQALVDHLFDRGIGQVGVDRQHAVADQHGKVMHFARLARFDHQADVGARALADQVVVQARNRQQGRDGGVLAVDAAVGEDDDLASSLAMMLVRRGEQFFQGLLQAGAIFGRVEQDRQGDRAEVQPVEVAELLQLFVGEDRVSSA